MRARQAEHWRWEEGRGEHDGMELIQSFSFTNTHCLLNEQTQDVRGKRLADSVEALIGATFLLSGGASALGMGKGVNGAASIIRDDLRWDSQTLMEALDRTALLCEALGVLPSGGRDVLIGMRRQRQPDIVKASAPSSRAGQTQEPCGVTPAPNPDRCGHSESVLQVDPDPQPPLTGPPGPRTPPTGSSSSPPLSAESRYQRRQRRIVREVSKLLGGYHFCNSDLLMEALTHCSYSVGPCNQVCTCVNTCVRVFVAERILYLMPIRPRASNSKESAIARRV